jgi:hypothetical protein
MSLGCEAPGVHVDLVTVGMAMQPMEGCESIRATNASKSIVLKQLSDLRGYVRISDGLMALRYVRLITSPETWFLWRTGHLNVEILEAADAAAMANYGLKRESHLINASTRMVGNLSGPHYYSQWWYDPTTRKMQQYRQSNKSGERDKLLATMRNPDFTLLGTGDMGILTQADFRTGGFSRAVVTKVAGGYQVTRWLFVEDYNVKNVKQSAQLVQEFVATDGDYRRTVVREISPAPTLRDGRFYIPKFE